MGKRLIIKGASFSANSIDRVSPSVTYYSVIYNLGNCTASNSATSIAAGSTYQVTIAPKSGYTISSVTVKHNGVTVNPSSGYTYVINNVSGNITITATATADTTTYTVTYDLVNATASNDTTVVTEGSSYSVTLSPASGYKISSATVTHNGSEVTPTSGYTYDIPSVGGNILVECVAVEDEVSPTVLATLTKDDAISSGAKGYYKTADGKYTTDSNYYGMWINVQQWVGKTLTVTAGASSTRISFTTAYESYNGNAGNFADGWGVDSEHGVYEAISANATKSYTIPSDAKYVWFYIYANGADKTPASIIVCDNL